MKYLTVFLAIVIAASPSLAFQLHVRDDDTGVMQQVEDITADTVLDFRLLPGSFDQSATTDLGPITYGPSLVGMTEACVETSDGGMNGTLDAREALPTTPLTIKPRRDDLGKIWNFYVSPPVGQEGHNSDFTFLNMSYRGCRNLGNPGGGAEYGASSWAVVFDEARTAIKIVLQMGTMLAGGRYHLQFFDELGNWVAHQDIVAGGGPVPGPFPDLQTFSWTSTVPIAAIAAWPANMIDGAKWASIILGEADDTEVAILAPPPTPKTLDLAEVVAALAARVAALEALH